MKLLFFISNMAGGGAERVMSVLCNELVKREYEVYLATDINTPITYDLDVKINIVSLYPEVRLKNNSVSRAIRTLSNIRHIVCQIKPDIVITFMFGMNVKVLLSTRWLSVPVIASVHTTYNQSMSFLKKIERYHIHNLASMVVLLTQYDARFVGNKIKHKVVISNPLPYGIVSETVKREKTVVAIGSLDRYYEKGFDRLICLWGQISILYPDWSLKIIGTGIQENVDYLQSLIKENGVQHSVFLLGFQKQVDVLLRKSEIFILTSSVEGFPMALLEAMSQGCACISFDCITGPAELITNEVNGLLIDNQNYDAMKSKLCRLIEDCSLRNKLSLEARQSAERFIPDKIVNKWEELFKYVVKK